jgi:gluconate kinase
MIGWLSGNSGAGKTFTGDYLSVVCGFSHVDGDDLYWSQEDGDKALFPNLIKAFGFWFEGKSAPPELWHPYFLRQCARAREAEAGGAKNVAVSLTVYHRETRDFVRQQLPDHVFVLLRCGRDELLRRSRVRFAEFAKARGETLEEAWAATHGGALYTEEVWEAETTSIMRGLMPLDQDELGSGKAIEIEVTEGGAHWAKLHEALGLPAPPAVIPTEAIAKINYDRFKAHAPPK